MLAGIFNAFGKISVIAAVAADDVAVAASTMSARVATEYACAKAQVAAVKEAQLMELLANFPQCFTGLTKDSTDAEVKSMIFNARKAQYIVEKAAQRSGKASKPNVETKYDMIRRIAAAKPYSHKS